MRPERAGATTGWAVPKGAQHQDTSGRGCAGSAGRSPCSRSYPRGLSPCWRADRRAGCRASDRGQGLRQRCHRRASAASGDAARHSAETEQKGATGIRQAPVPPAASGRERIPVAQAVARHRHARRETAIVVPRRRTDSLSRAVASNLVRTVSRRVVSRRAPLPLGESSSGAAPRRLPEQRPMQAGSPPVRRPASTAD